MIAGVEAQRREHAEPAGAHRARARSGIARPRPRHRRAQPRPATTFMPPRLVPHSPIRAPSMSRWPAEVRECRRDVLTLVARRDMLPRLTVGCPGVSVVEREGGDARRGEVLFVLSQHHVVRRTQSVYQHDRRVRARACGQRQPRRAPGAHQNRSPRVRSESSQASPASYDKYGVRMATLLHVRRTCQGVMSRLHVVQGGQKIARTVHHR